MNSLEDVIPDWESFTEERTNKIIVHTIIVNVCLQSLEGIKNV